MAIGKDVDVPSLGATLTRRRAFDMAGVKIPHQIAINTWPNWWILIENFRVLEGIQPRNYISGEGSN